MKHRIQPAIYQRLDSSPDKRKVPGSIPGGRTQRRPDTVPLEL